MRACPGCSRRDPRCGWCRGVGAVPVTDEPPPEGFEDVAEAVQLYGLAKDYGGLDGAARRLGLGGIEGLDELAIATVELLSQEVERLEHETLTARAAEEKRRRQE